MNGFAKSLGVELEIHTNLGGWGALLPSLVHGDGDVAVCEPTITPQREKIAAFSRPYHSTWLAIAVRQDSKIAALADLAGKRGALLSGSSHVDFLKQEAPDVPLTLTRFNQESFEAVENSSADFTVVETSLAPGEKVPLHPSLKVAFRLRSVGDGIAMRKESDLLAPLNTYLTNLETSGELKRIVERKSLVRQAGSDPRATAMKN